ncbi:MAG: amino acid ABC transporter permease [Treponema sp.]|nr:amino acid ABC transporter permease [Treponema sp.]
MEKGLFYWIGYILKQYWPYFIKGMFVTLWISILGTLLGYILGFLIGLVQSTPVSPEDSRRKKVLYGSLKIICRIFVAIFRGTPMMVQAMVIYYGLKTSGVDISPFTASILVLMLNTGAYMAETVRGGIISVDKGQLEGGFAMGMSHSLTMFTVVLPQAFRNIIPEMVNMFLTNLKMTSELNVIGVAELYFTTKTAAGTYYRYFEAYIICALIYFILCTFFTKLLSYVEQKTFVNKDYELAVEYMDNAE